MVKVTAAEVNKLRKTTGAGMMDCKKALVEAEGNFDTAIEILRKKGQKVAAKRADRESSEGVAIAISNEGHTSGVGIVLACETDFVGKNADFIDLAHKIAANGLKLRKRVSFHGISININPNLEHFSGIIPCGEADFGVTSINDLGISVSMDDFDRALKSNFYRLCK